MSTNPTQVVGPRCSRHSYLDYCGWYDAAHDVYKHSCGDVLCPRHGIGACRQSYHRKLRALRPGWGFATFIIFFNKKPSPDEVKSYRKLIRKSVLSWDREAKICLPLHPKQGKWHLNVGIHSKWVFKMTNRHWWGQYVNNRIAGWWDGNRMRYPKGAPRKADFDAMRRKLEDDLVHLCAKGVLKRPRPARLEQGRFRNQPKRWLWYVLRCKSGWSNDEKIPRRQGYRLVTGFVAPRKKRLNATQPTPSVPPALPSVPKCPSTRIVVKLRTTETPRPATRPVAVTTEEGVCRVSPSFVARGPPSY